MSAAAHDLPREAVNAKLASLIASGAVVLGVQLSGFVIREPAPYEIYMAGLIAVWALFGLRVSRAAAPLAVLLVLFNVGGMIAMTQMPDLMETPLYLAVSLFLAFTAVFYAAVVEARPQLLRPIFLAYVVSAIVTSLFGIAGYFHLFPGAEMFTRYDRATGVFQDPNVFGPFLALPGIYLLHRLLTGPAARMPLIAIPLLIVMAGIFLSFSRGAWGLFGTSAVLLTGALFLQSRSGAFRLRIVVMTIAAIALLALALIVLLQVPGVADMLTMRARLAQDYDSARLGRFARYVIGFQLALEKPLGIGPWYSARFMARTRTHLAESADGLWLAGLRVLSGADAVDPGGGLPPAAARPALATLPAVRLCGLCRTYRARDCHRHGPLAPLLPAARPDLGRDRAGIPASAAETLLFRALPAWRKNGCRIRLTATGLSRTSPAVRSVAQPGSALDWGSRGRGFESATPTIFS